VDQVRAKLQIDGPYVAKEKSVGQFKDMQAATNIYSLQHNIQQWLFLSRGKAISPAEGLGIDGWQLNIVTEKNKLAPSQHAVTCVFDMNHGLDKFWSEYTFLSEKTPSEKKIYKDNKLPFPLMVEKYNAQRYQLHVTNPEDSSVNYTSSPFYRKEAKKKYQQDEEFRQWFDYAIQVSAYYRITQGMFKEEIDLSTTQTQQNKIDDVFQTDEEDSKVQEVVEQTPDTQEDSYESVF